MKPDCLNERDLILLHYGEAPDGATSALAIGHLALCPDCQARRARLADDLGRIPVAVEPDPAAVTRVAARVSERLNQRRRWLPLAGAAVGGAMALATAVVVWLPADPPPVRGTPQPIATLQSPSSGLLANGLDLDLLEQLDLLEELETLQAIEGV